MTWGNNYVFYSISLPLPCTSISIFRIVLFNAQQTLLAHKYPLFWVLVLNSIHCSKINITYITIFYALFHAIGLGVLSLYWNAYHLLAESLRFTMLKWWSSKTWGTLYIISKTSCFSSTRLSYRQFLRKYVFKYSKSIDLILEP